MQPNLIMTIGAQGSGKSTWAKKYIAENTDVLYLSTDDIWLSIGPMEDRSIAKKVYPKLTRLAEAALRNGQSVLLDATFIKRDWRKDYVKLGRQFKARLVAHVFKADRKTLIERVQQRAAGGGLDVPVHVIDRYIAMFDHPTFDEFDEIVVH